MSAVKERLVEALRETDLGSGILAADAAVEAAAIRLSEVVREAQAKAVDDIAWQWWVSDLSAEETRARLHALAQAIRNGSLWEAEKP